MAKDRITPGRGRTNDSSPRARKPELVVGGGTGTLTSVAPSPTHEAIAARAWELFRARGGEHGHDLEDWLEAERQLRVEQALES